MLAFKMLSAGGQPPRTMVFDEVDAGIGGRTAAVVGEKLRRLGAATQVLCITHLPPIAAQAATQFAIAKRVRGSRTVTTRRSAGEAMRREREIARMMGGEGAPTAELLAGARDLLAQAKARSADGESERRKSSLGRKRKGARTLSKWPRKYLIETYGCQMNVHDSERMAGLLEAAGFEPTDADDDADLVVINTCSVREKAEEKLYTRLGDLKGLQHRVGRAPMVAVTGCVAQQEGGQVLARSPLVDVVLGTQRRRMLPLLVDAGGGRGSRSVDVATPYDDADLPVRR